MDDATDHRQNGASSVPRLFDEIDQLDQQLAAARARRLFLGLDFDGTLAPHVNDPSAAEPTAETRQTVQALSRRDGVDTAVISGRALDDVRARVGIDGIEYAGNHGLELNGASPLSDPEATRERVQTVCDRLKTEIDHENCMIENKGITATVHYRQIDDEKSIARIRSIVETVVNDVDASGLRCTDGANIVEIRPAIDWDKGKAVQWFVDRRSEECLPMYIGDDTTDEDVFRAIAPDGIGVHVGTDETAATYRVDDVEAVAALLKWLADTGVNDLTERR